MVEHAARFDALSTSEKQEPKRFKSETLSILLTGIIGTALIVVFLLLLLPNNNDNGSSSQTSVGIFDTSKDNNALSSPVPSSSESLPKSDDPTTIPTSIPSILPSTLPSEFPSSLPSILPSHESTIIPTSIPSLVPSTLPLEFPSSLPSILSSHPPTTVPSNIPSQGPSVLPSIRPTAIPSVSPTQIPTLYPTFKPTRKPLRQPTFKPTDARNTGVTYFPGKLKEKDDNGLSLSHGLTSRIIARKGEKVIFNSANATQAKSATVFHDEPDAGACFEEGGGRWTYVSNSELDDKKGGVGAITFDNNGDVFRYGMVLENTSRNCGGGRTYWNTWISCEENGSKGQIYETYPNGSRKARQTILGTSGGNFESMAYDNHNRLKPTFYITNDNSSGELRRYTPSLDIVKNAEASGDYSRMLHTRDSGTFHYLELDYSNNKKTFVWTKSKTRGRASAKLHFPNSEGIDVRDGKLYFVSKIKKRLIILNLSQMTFVQESTNTGSFVGQPDQVKFMVGSENNNHRVLYFTEEGSGHNGIHGRYPNGRKLQILEAHHGGETTGLAFSPNKKHMYFAVQTSGILFDIWREDGLPFDGATLDIKYHSVH